MEMQKPLLHVVPGDRAEATIAAITAEGFSLQDPEVSNEEIADDALLYGGVFEGDELPAFLTQAVYLEAGAIDALEKANPEASIYTICVNGVEAREILHWETA